MSDIFTDETHAATEPKKKPAPKRRKTRAKRAYRKREPKAAPLEPVPMPACSVDPPTQPKLRIEPPIVPDAPARPQFEYGRIYLGPGEPVDTLLDAMGAQGWEMVGVLGDWWGVFKRCK
jgi:hypothetical protein